MNMKDIKEQSAAVAHELWAHWMKYFYSIHYPDHNAWKRLMETPYAKLSEQEKESDRKVAELYIISLLNSFAQQCLDALPEKPISTPMEAINDEHVFTTSQTSIDNVAAGSHNAARQALKERINSLLGV